MSKLSRMISEGELLVPAVNEFLISEPDKILGLSKSDIKLINKLLDIQAERGEERTERTSFSAGKSSDCMRNQVIHTNGMAPEGAIDPGLALIFLDGIWRNVSWVVVFHQMGILIETEETRYNKRWNISYTPDAIVDLSKYHPEMDGVDKVGVEIKGANSYVFSQFKKGEDKSKWAYKRWMQIHTYMLASGAKFWVAFVQDKNTQKFHEQVIKRHKPTIEFLKVRYDYMNRAKKRNRLPAIECDMDSSDPKYKDCDQSENCLKLHEGGTKRIKPLQDRAKFERKIIREMIRA